MSEHSVRMKLAPAAQLRSTPRVSWKKRSHAIMKDPRAKMDAIAGTVGISTERVCSALQEKWCKAVGDMGARLLTIIDARERTFQCTFWLCLIAICRMFYVHLWPSTKLCPTSTHMSRNARQCRRQRLGKARGRGWRTFWRFGFCKNDPGHSLGKRIWQ